MSDWFDTSVRLQKQLLEAQKRALDAGAHANAARQALVQAQAATRRAAEANFAAWQAWTRAWSIGRW